MDFQRTPAAKKAKQLAKYLRSERPDYNYLKSVWSHLRTELEIEVPKAEKKLPDVPVECSGSVNRSAKSRGQD